MLKLCDYFISMEEIFTDVDLGVGKNVFLRKYRLKKMKLEKDLLLEDDFLEFVEIDQKQELQIDQKQELQISVSPMKGFSFLEILCLLNIKQIENEEQEKNFLEKFRKFLKQYRSPIFGILLASGLGLGIYSYRIQIRELISALIIKNMILDPNLRQLKDTILNIESLNLNARQTRKLILQKIERFKRMNLGESSILTGPKGDRAKRYLREIILNLENLYFLPQDKNSLIRFLEILKPKLDEICSTNRILLIYCHYIQSRNK